ncbi:MAG: tetratricopeptide repeat protein [Limisphaerales bacterium]
MRINWIGSMMAVALVAAGCASRPKAHWAASPRNVVEVKSPAPPRTNSVAEPRAEALAHFAAAVSYEANTNHVLALTHFEQAAQADPGNEPLVIELSRQYLARKETQKALDLLSKAAKHPNATPEVSGWLAEAYLKCGKTNQAIEAGRHSMVAWPTALEGYRSLAAIYLQTGQPQESLKVLNRAAKVQNVDANFLIGLADFYAAWAQDRSEKKDQVKAQAVALLGRAVTMKPAAELIQHVADTYNHFGETKKAAQFYLQVLTQESEPSVQRDAVREELANIYLQSDDRKGAYEQLEAIVRDNPTRYPQAWYELGVLAYEDKNLIDAARNFEKALLLNTNLQRAYYNLALVQIDLGHNADAVKTLATANAKFRNSFLDEFFSGIAHMHMKNYKEAVYHFTAAEVIAKVKDPARLTYDFYFQFGAACERNHDYKEAEKHFLKCIDQSPDSPEALNYLGFMWAEHGQNLERARELIEKAVKKEPKNGAYLDSMGWVLFKLNQPREALTWLLKAQELTPEPDATLLDHLGDVYVALNQEEKAHDAWKKSLSLEANDDVQKKLASGKKAGN